MAQTALPTLWRYNPISSVVDAFYSPDGSLIAVAGNGGVQIYSVSTGALIQDLSGNLNENNMAFSPDGKTVAVASGPVQVWDVATGTLIETLVAGNAEFGIGIQTWVTFSPDGTTLAACSLSTDSFGLVTTWNVATGVQTRLSATSGNYFLDGIAYSPDGSKLAICGGGYVPVLQILDATTGFEVASFSSSATTVLSLAYSPDGKSLAAGGTRVNTGNNPTSGVLELWDVSSGQLIKSLPTASSSVNSVAFSPDGTLLADGTTSAGLVTGDAELWNVKSGSLAKTLDSPSKSVVTSVAFSPGGKSIVSSGQDYRSATRLLSEVDIWNVPSAALTTAILPAIFSPTGIAYSSDGSTFASWGTSVNTAAKTIDNWVGILNPSTGKVTSSFTPDGVVTSAAFSANGSILATGGYKSSTGRSTTRLVEIWSVPTGKRTASLASAITKVNSVAFSPDGITLADAGTIDRAEVTYGAIELWNLSNGRKIASIVTGMNANVTSIAISPDGTTLATCSQISVFDFHYGVIALWSVQTGALITTFDTGRLISDTVAFSPDGKKLACGGTRYVSGVSEGGLDLWDISTRRLLSSLPMNPIGGSVNAVDFSSDGRVLLAGTSSGLQTFSAADYSLMNTFTGGGITSIAVSSGSLPIILLGQAGLQAISNP